MATDAILETIKPRRSASRENLPVTNSVGKDGGGDHLIGLRRRMSSFSVRIQPLSSASAGAFRRASSMPSTARAMAAGAGALRRWWDLGVGWVMNRKPSFARDLEMNDDEAAVLGCHCRGTWRHVFFKIRASARRLLGRDGLPLSSHDFRYDSVSYAHNFDNGDAAA
uniref:Uncharacterized protein n=1 Tax=Leersia perrieri TaxID=77586 RepID=A0A0D9X9N1_9ORYZ